MEKDDIKQQPKATDWPKPIRTRDELDSALEAGEKSGVSSHTIPEIVERTLARIKNG